MQQLSFPETIKEPTVPGATVESLAVDVTAPVHAESTVNATAPVHAQAPVDVPDTVNALSTVNPEAAVNAESPVNAPSTVNAPETSSKESKHDFAKMNGVITREENSAPGSQSEPTEEIPEPEEVITVKQVWQKPWPKASIVGGGMLVLLGTLGSMVHGAMDAINTPAPRSIEKTVATPTPTADQEDSPGSLKTKNALTSQEYELRMLNQQHMKRHQPTTAPRPRLVTNQVPPRSNVVERTASSTTAPTTIAPAVAASEPVSLSAQQPKPIATPQPTTPIKATPAPVIDPTQQWEMAANAGSYSSNAIDNAVSQNNSAVTKSSTVHAINHQGIADQDFSLNPLPSQNTNPWNDSCTKWTSLNNTDMLCDRQISQKRLVHFVPEKLSPPNVLVGTRVAGKLETPVAWSGDSRTPTQNFLIKLSEPIKGIDTRVLVPKGAYIVATVSKVSSAGLLEMRADKLLVNEQEQQLPPDSILILAHNGNLLKAQLKNGTRVGSALGTALLNGVSTAASLVNQPSVQTSFGSLNSFSSTLSNRSNVVAGLAQGATAQLVQQAQARRERALQAADALKVFELPGGTSVQLFFNQSVFLQPGIQSTESSPKETNEKSIQSP
jgi:hypothetical protein